LQGGREILHWNGKCDNVTIIQLIILISMSEARFSMQRINLNFNWQHKMDFKDEYVKAGARAFWVKTIGQSGIGNVTIKSEKYGDNKIVLEVNKSTFPGDTVI